MGIRRQRWCCYWISSPILPYSLFLLLLSLSFPPSFTQPINMNPDSLPKKKNMNPDSYYDECANSPPFHCGNIQAADIKYPFWAPGRPEFCGHPGFNLTCQDGDKLMISIGHDKRSYHVMKEIDYQDRVLHVIDAQLLDDATTSSSSSCPEKLSNTTLDFSLFSYLDGNKDINLTLFLNCTKDLLDSPPNPNPVFDLLFPITECSNAFFGNYSYFTWHSMIDEPSLRDLYDKYCLSMVLLPVYNNNLIQFAPPHKPGNANFFNATRSGFGLTWNVGCNDECLKSHGICGFIDFQTVCFCPKGTANNGSACTNTSTHSTSIASESGGKKKTGIIIGGVLGGLVAGIFMICCLWWLCSRTTSQQHTSSTLLCNSVSCWHSRTSEDQTIEAFLQKHGTLPPKRYRYLEVKRMTESFHHKLGEGGFGSVFKGTLADGRAVAVKLLNNTNGDGEDFLNEVASIGRTSHINIVSLLGFCFQGSKRALIYDFMPNGSLEKYIYAEDPKTILGWEKLFQIAIGIARGLEYLHLGCNTRIVHFDIKPHNILLDEDFCPKISDFGLAKLGTHKESILSMAGARGTVGFIAPEVFSRNFGVVSTKSDVYSYGMMLLEMTGGRRNVKVIVDRTSEIYFPHWIYDHLHEQDEWLQYCRVTLDAQEIARKLIIVGLWCIQTRPECRPTMSQVVEMLQGSITDLKIPPKPYMSSPPRSPCTCSMASLC